MKQHEELFKRLNLTLEQIFAQSQKEGKIGSWVFCCDTHECWLSDEAYRLLLIEKASNLNFKTILSLIHPEDIRTIKNVYKRIFAEHSQQFIHRIKTNGKIKYFEQNCKLYGADGSGLPYIIGNMQEISRPKRKKDSAIDKQHICYEAINNYLAKTINCNDLHGIVANAKKTINKMIDAVLINIFVVEDGALKHIVTKSCISPQCFSFQDEKEFIAYQAVVSGNTKVCDIEEYINQESKKELKSMGIQSIVAMPIKHEDQTVAAISIGLKHKNALSKEEFAFCSTVCNYFSEQLQSAKLHHKLKKEIDEKNRTESDLENFFIESIDYICIVDKDGNFIRMNPTVTNRLGLTEQELIGRSILDFVHPEDKAYAKYIINNMITIGGVHGIYQRFVCKNNDILYLQINAKYSSDTETIMGIARDVTDQKEAEAKNLELEKSIALEKLKGEFFANLSHEFKTPLNIIISSLDLLKLKISRDNESLFESDYKKFISYAYQNCYKLLRLTTNLLDSIKIENQFLKTHFSYCELILLAEEITKSAAVYANARGISISFTTDVDISSLICCDMDKVDRILLNLISNAIKNTPVGGKVKVHISEDSDYFSISVKDTGVGIPEHVLPNVFEKFQVTEKGFVGNFDSNGIGLSIVKSLVEMHNGTIWVESQLGSGSCFTFTISKDLTPEPRGGNLPDGMSYDVEARQSRLKMELSNIS